MISSYIKFVLLLALLFALSVAAKYTVVIRGFIPEEKISAHCYSSEDDLGNHVLSYRQSFIIRFTPNFFRTTKFYCDMISNYGFGNYGVYTRRINSMCHQYCLWCIAVIGPCLKTKTKPNGFYCQPWKINNPPPRVLPSLPVNLPTIQGH